jgi:hypothetical protein
MKANSIPAQRSRSAVVMAGPIVAMTGTANAAPSCTLSIEPIAMNSGLIPAAMVGIGEVPAFLGSSI